ncbi:hypothetical protein JTB14_015310 [Gonioctena quinquepunctata]|nr:hypothetical protein JTB14_015310 [Gonioctena quinquepunctata]
MRPDQETDTNFGDFLVDPSGEIFRTEIPSSRQCGHNGRSSISQWVLPRKRIGGILKEIPRENQEDIWESIRPWTRAGRGCTGFNVVIK